MCFRLGICFYNASPNATRILGCGILHFPSDFLIVFDFLDPDLNLNRMLLPDSCTHFFIILPKLSFLYQLYIHFFVDFIYIFFIILLKLSFH